MSTLEFLAKFVKEAIDHPTKGTVITIEKRGKGEIISAAQEAGARISAATRRYVRAQKRKR